ncbi:uncharacterized protein F5891DRAFT_1194154 [Suillus fuscotomentosus]|uniref:Uncharacterized protein n=2 Tax=Suillus fuscotomentosus TaxID=1912939 RepID=A0AAD4HGK3_9AGAM|nr:uncharacterized protein F5891DRAFT_1194154 [Suillus fuscotomentosus]KAG1895436.1 hypothetical protein F5891DRAFT_1194154 [Suillus fuscotomentosus]
MPRFRLGGYFMDYSTARKVAEQLAIDIRQGQGFADWDDQHMEWPFNDWLANNGRLNVKVAGIISPETDIEGILFVSTFLHIEDTDPGPLTETVNDLAVRQWLEELGVLDGIQWISMPDTQRIALGDVHLQGYPAILVRSHSFSAHAPPSTISLYISSTPAMPRGSTTYKRLPVENTARHKQLWIGVVLKALEDLDPPFMSLPRRKQLWIGVVLKALEDLDPPFISLPRRKQLWIGVVLKALEDLDPPSRVLHIPPAA